MTRYDVARDTVRDAIGLLTHEGLVTPKRGTGTVVREIDPVTLSYSPRTPAQTWQAQTAGAGREDGFRCIPPRPPGLSTSTPSASISGDRGGNVRFACQRVA
jgi:hypothetical protein